MKPMPYQAISTDPIGGGEFDDLPGGPWKILPPGINRGFLLPALVANSFFEDTGATTGDFEFFGLYLTARNAGVYEDASGNDVGVFHFIGDEFEALMMLPADLSHFVMSCRGSSAAFADAAALLLANEED